LFSSSSSDENSGEVNPDFGERGEGDRGNDDDDDDELFRAASRAVALRSLSFSRSARRSLSISRFANVTQGDTSARGAAATSKAW
jgi:hypothetical protein